MSTRKIRAFTLIELLTVIAVIAVLAAILIPAVSKVRRSANSSKSVSNLRQIANALAVYTNQAEGKYPTLNGPPDRDVSSSQFFWPQALEEAVLDWDRGSSGKHPIFTDPTASKSHGISDYGGNALFFGDSNPNNPNRVNKYRTIYDLEDPANVAVVATAHHPNSEENVAAWYIQGDFAASGTGGAIPEARLSSNQVGLVFADGHVETVDREKLFGDDAYRMKIFNPDPQ
jgi:prepilin-type N-terminal cleavage/methylation domain-containing protein/prepilin-type processing-associated H-X9-DG protein